MKSELKNLGMGGSSIPCHPALPPTVLLQAANGVRKTDDIVYDIVYNIEYYVHIRHHIRCRVRYDLTQFHSAAATAKRWRFKVSAPLCLDSRTRFLRISSATLTEIVLGNALP